MDTWDALIVFLWFQVEEVSLIDYIFFFLDEHLQSVVNNLKYLVVALFASVILLWSFLNLFKYSWAMK